MSGAGLPKRSLYGQSSSGIPKPRPSAYAGYDSGIPKSVRPPGTSMSRQSSGYGLSRPSAGYGLTSAVKSNGAFSARKSIFNSARKSHTPQTHRPSFNPSSVTSTASRQSIGGQRAVTEDRPISDATYHKQCVSKLNDFLQQIGQQPLPPRFCASPSSSDIRRAFDMLLRELGINISQIGQANRGWDSELPVIMRNMGYRYQIPKKFLIGSTSAHSKGQLFGVFEFLVDTISYISRSGLQNVMYQAQDQNVDLRRELLKVACSEAGVQEQKLSLIEETLYGTEEQHQDMKQQVVAIEQEISAVEHEIKQGEELKRLLSELDSECVKFEKYAQEISEQLEAQREAAEKEVPVLEQKSIETESLIMQQEEKNKKILNQLNDQEFGQDDLKWARERQQHLKEEADREMRGIEEQKRSLRDIRLTVKQEEDKQFKMQNDIHSLLMSLKEAVLSPSISAYVQQMRNHLQNKNLDNAAQFLIESVSQTPDAAAKRIALRDLTREYKVLLLQQTVALENNVMPCSDQKLKDLQSNITEQQKSNQILKDKIAELNHDMESDRQEKANEHARLKKEYENNQMFLKELDDNLRKSETETAARVHKLSEKVEKEEAELQLQQQEQMQWLRDYTSDQRTIFNLMLESVEKKVQQMKPYVENLEQEKDRQKIRIERMHKKISDHKASKQPKK
jgi:hypothetical protein